MAETYETSIYKQTGGQGQGGQSQTQTGASPPPPQTTGGEQYETPIYKTQTGGTGGGGQQTTVPPAPVATAPKPAASPTVAPDLPGSPRNPSAPMLAPSAPQQTTTGGQSQQPADWSIDWSKGGEVKLPQSVQDWSTLAAQNSLMGLYPGLTAQADAARKRLDPVTAASADVAGGVASPTTLLNAVPVVGPELAGGLHEGIKSAVTNWKPDESWPTYLKNVGLDTTGGVVAGAAGQGTAYAAEKALPELIKAGVVTGATAAGHKLLGGGLLPDFGKELPGLFGIYKGVDKVADWVGEKGKDLISSPAAQQAIKNLVLGAGSAFRQGTGPYDQWIPGQ